VRTGGQRYVTFPERSWRTVRLVNQADPPPLRHQGQVRPFRLASPATALAVSGVVLALMAAEFPLSGLAHQDVSASGGGVPIWFSAPFVILGFVLAWRTPGNRLGWMILSLGVFSVLSEDASFYVVACYRLRHGGLPLGWVALLAQPSWSVTVVLIGLVFLLFPDGHLPSPRLGWLLWAYLAVGTLWMAGAFGFTVSAITGHDIQVDSGGNLQVLSGHDRSAAWWGAAQNAVILAIAVSWLVSLAGQVISYRRSSGERRQQLKWLLGGSVASLAGIALKITVSSAPGWPGVIGSVCLLPGVFALPAAMGVAILKYRLYDIDRIISRTVAYAIVTGLLVGVYAGLVLLTTRVLTVRGPVAVAAATLAAAALFNPVRRRVQRLVDRRFNRAKYDADRTVAAFAARLKDAVELDAVRNDLAGVVQSALEPAHVWLWTSAPE
jgi:hypothetical protein